MVPEAADKPTAPPPGGSCGARNRHGPLVHPGSERAFRIRRTTARSLLGRSKPFRRPPHPSLRWRNPAPHRLPGARPLAASGAGPLIGRRHAACSRNTAEPVLHPVPGPAADGCSAAHVDACAPAGLPAAPAVDAAVMRRAELTGALVAGTPRRAAVAACCRIVRAWPQFNALTGCSVIVDFGRCCIAVLAFIDAHSSERLGHAQL